MDLESVLKSGAPAAGTSLLLFAGALGNQIKPSRLSCLGFGGAFAAGTYMIYDGDYKNGSGFIATWGLLYSMVNGKQLIKGGGMYGRLSALTALGVAGLYGREFIRTPAINQEGLLAEKERLVQQQQQNQLPPK